MEALERIGVEICLGTAVVDVDDAGLTVRDAAGETHRIESACKVWSAGVAASPLGHQLADQSGASLDRAGRVAVESDLTLPRHPEVFVVGDMMSHDELPGVAQVAIQGGRYAARQVSAEVTARANGQNVSPRQPFQYRDKGSLPTISRFNAVAKIGRLETVGFFAWLLWLAVHVAYIVGFRSRIATMLSWAWSFLGTWRGQLTTTEQQTTARIDIGRLRHLHAVSEAEPTSVKDS